MLRLTRWLSVSAQLRNRGPLIDNIILDQLRDSSRLNKSSSFLILKPKKKRDSNRTAPRRVSLPKPAPTSKLLLPDEASDEDPYPYIQLINNLKIYNNKVSENKFNSIVNQIIESFTAPQLRHYIQTYYSDPNFKGTIRGVSKRPKSKLAKIIATELWNIEKSGEKTSVEDFFITTEIELLKPDIFILFTRGGLLVKYLSRTGCKISFNSKNNKIKFTGTEGQVNSANIILNSIISNKRDEDVDLSTIRKSYTAKFNNFDLEHISKVTQVHFEHLGNDVYKLISLNDDQIQRAKRLLLWSLESNTRVQNFCSQPVAPAEELSYVPFVDDEALSWVDRLKNLFRLTTTTPKEISEDVEKQLQVFNDEALMNNSDLSLRELNDIKSIITPGPESSQDPLETKPSTLAREEHIEEIHTFLTQNAPESIEPVFGVTLGTILHQGPAQNSLEVKPDEITPDYIFNTNVQLAADSVLHYRPFSNPVVTKQDLNAFTTNDPHDYCVQIKFQPSLYHGASIDLPPVEMWFYINKFGRPEMDTLQLLTAESEKNYHLSLPDQVSDLKITSLYSQDLIGEEPQEAESESPLNIEDMLSSASAKYKKFQVQPGLNEFLEKSVLDFLGKRKPKIFPTLKLKLPDGTEATYHYITMNYRRQLELSFRGKLLTLSVNEGGTLGGRSTEITMTGSESGEEYLRTLIKHAHILVKRL